MLMVKLYEHSTLHLTHVQHTYIHTSCLFNDWKKINKLLKLKVPKFRNVKYLHSVNKVNFYAYISSLKLKSSTIRLFGKFELILTLNTKYLLPFYPDSILRIDLCIAVNTRVIRQNHCRAFCDACVSTSGLIHNWMHFLTCHVVHRRQIQQMISIHWNIQYVLIKKVTGWLLCSFF